MMVIESVLLVWSMSHFSAHNCSHHTHTHIPQLHYSSLLAAKVQSTDWNWAPLFELCAALPPQSIISLSRQLWCWAASKAKPYDYDKKRCMKMKIIKSTKSTKSKANTHTLTREKHLHPFKRKREKKCIVHSRQCKFRLLRAKQNSLLLTTTGLLLLLFIPALFFHPLPFLCLAQLSRWQWGNEIIRR